MSNGGREEGTGNRNSVGALLRRPRCLPQAHSYIAPGVPQKTDHPNGWSILWRTRRHSAAARRGQGPPPPAFRRWIRLSRLAGQESRPPCWATCFLGAPGGIRTHGLPLRRRTLYPAELRRRVLNLRLFYHITIHFSTKSVCCNNFLGGERSILLSY